MKILNFQSQKRELFSVALLGVQTHAEKIWDALNDFLARKSVE